MGRVMKLGHLCVVMVNTLPRNTLNVGSISDWRNISHFHHTYDRSVKHIDVHDGVDHTDVGYVIEHSDTSVDVGQVNYSVHYIDVGNGIEDNGVGVELIVVVNGADHIDVVVGIRLINDTDDRDLDRGLDIQHNDAGVKQPSC